MKLRRSLGVAFRTSQSTLTPLLGALLLLLGSIIYLPAPTQATSCDDLKIIFARGSGSSLRAVDETAWRQALDVQLKTSNLKYSFYELGSAPQDGHQYPAVAVDGPASGYLNLIGAFISRGEALNFGASVDEGSAELQAYIQKVSQTCPHTKFILGGYSQGAMVISRNLSQLNPDRILYAATFGDPKIYLPEGAGVPAAACLGGPMSSYRVYVPDCQAYRGILGGYEPYQPAGYEGKLGTWCNGNDIMCSSHFNLDKHLAYVSDNLYFDASKLIAAKVQAAFPNAWTTDSATGSGFAANHSTHDLAILIDSTGSMGSHISTYRAEARRLAKKVFAAGGRVALYEYRDLADGFQPVQLCDFSCSEADFITKLNRISVDGGGDDPESALSALLTTLNTLEWKVGATKSIVLLTDATYLSPDRDGTTLLDVARRSLEIDPVNVFVLTETDHIADYTELATATGGQVFNLKTNLALSTDTIFERTNITLALPEYRGQPGDTFTFVASGIEPYPGLVYRWDLDGDNHFETITTEPQASISYASDRDLYIQVKARDQAGWESAMSARVIVAPAPKAAKITSLSADSATGASRTIHFEATAATNIVVTLDDAIMGLLNTDQGSFTVTDLTSAATLTLTPYDADGRRGQPASLTLTPTAVSQSIASSPTSPSTPVKTYPKVPNTGVGPRLSAQNQQTRN